MPDEWPVGSQGLKVMMVSRSLPVPDDRYRAPDLRQRIVCLYSALIGCNIAIWFWAFIQFRHQSLMLGSAFLAYGLGLRHAVDADHIAAIDNVTRRLVQAGKRPLTVGFYFALGHATIVILATLGTVLLSTVLQHRFAHFRAVGGWISTLVSAVFLLALAFGNLVVLRGVWRAYRQVRTGGGDAADALTILLDGRGLLVRWLRPVFRFIHRSWHMFFLGFLFGLGFDTATEVSLLGLSATEATHGVALGSLMVFPLLFAAGMTLIDTTDGVLMLGAYRWAFVHPLREVSYNLVVTLVSVLIAFLIGMIETLRLIDEQIHHTRWRLGSGPDWFWRGVDRISDHFDYLGYAIITFFVVAWAVSVLGYRSAKAASKDVR